MKRSRINALVRDAKTFFDTHRFRLPPWAFWTPEQWKGLGDTEVVLRRLGWDLTDYGAGDFERKGLLLFTLRNGDPVAADAKKYAEKIMIVRENQVCPMHFHWSKTEDIINRGGGDLVVELFGSTEDEGLSDEPVTVQVDGLPRQLEPGGHVVLAPGQSIFLARRMYHRFYGAEGKGTVLVGEVSAVNDDNADNRFFEPQARFPHIDEDEPPLHLLCTDYPHYV